LAAVNVLVAKVSLEIIFNINIILINTYTFMELKDFEKSMQEKAA
jgi:hypothetical protein